MQIGFPARLRTLRQQRGLTQGVLARAIGVSKASVCHWEAGRVRPRQHSVIALAGALDVPMIDLMKGAQGRIVPLQASANETLSDAIGEAKVRIAALAGTEPARVTISLSY